MKLAWSFIVVRRRRSRTGTASICRGRMTWGTQHRPAFTEREVYELSLRPNLSLIHPTNSPAY